MHEQVQGVSGGEKSNSHGEISADQILFETIKENLTNTKYLCINAPLQLPKCMRCRLKCPGFEKCKEPEIQWMWKQHKKNRKQKPRAKIFTPYTQRACEIYIAQETEPTVYPLEALGANLAPLTARAYFLLRRLPSKLEVIEVHPRLTVLRVGQSLRVAKSHLQHYKNSLSGEESRLVFLQTLIKHDIFIYQQDLQKLVENPHCFDAFIAALTGYLKFIKQCEPIPRDFPIEDGWIEFPKMHPDLL